MRFIRNLFRPSWENEEELDVVEEARKRQKTADTPLASRTHTKEVHQRRRRHKRTNSLSSISQLSSQAVLPVKRLEFSATLGRTHEKLQENSLVHESQPETPKHKTKATSEHGGAGVGTRGSLVARRGAGNARAHPPAAAAAAADPATVLDEGGLSAANAGDNADGPCAAGKRSSQQQQQQQQQQIAMTAQGSVALPEVVTTVVPAKRTKHAAAAAADESPSSSSSRPRYHQVAQQHLDRSLSTGPQGEKTRATTGFHEAAGEHGDGGEEEEEEEDDEDRVVTVTQGRATAAAASSSAIITSVAPPSQYGLEDGEQQEEEYAYDPYEYIRHLPLRTYAQRILLPPLKHRKPTLVLDLDETLVHSTIEPPPPGSPPPDHVFSVTLENTTYNVFVRVRPNMHRFLAEVAKLFELVVFTASQEAYAGRLLDMLDTERHIGHRLYRDACVLVEGNFVKDLDMLGRDLHHTTIVDNSPLAFAYHLDNGIPIESWFGERSDNHLLALMPFLRELARADDVRPLIRKKYAVAQRRHTTFTY